MSFPPALYLAAGGAAFVMAIVTFPWWRRWCVRIGLVDDPGGRKTHREPIPLAGGLTVMTGLLAPILVAVALLGLGHVLAGAKTGETPAAVDGSLTDHLFSLDHRITPLLVYGLNKRATELIAIFLGAAGMLLIGLLDDKHELRPAVKFTGQLLVALLVAAAGARITLFVPNLLFSYSITVLWILTVINAFNFMDNMNGLCTGLGAIGAVYFAIIAAASGQYLVALIAFLACGALLGFLPYNFPRAQAFLGDAGSHLVGYLLAILAILPHFYTHKHPKALAVLSPLLILAMPLGDLVRVVIVRWRMKRPFYLGDTNHLSHALVRSGLSHTKAVLLIWLLAALLGGMALALALV